MAKQRMNLAEVLGSIVRVSLGVCVVHVCDCLFLPPTFAGALQYSGSESQEAWVS